MAREKGMQQTQGRRGYKEHTPRKKGMQTTRECKEQGNMRKERNKRLQEQIACNYIAVIKRIMHQIEFVLYNSSL